MARTSKKIDPIAVAAHAMKRVQTLADYNRIAAANTRADIEAAWQTLSPEDQQRISNICNDSSQPDLSAIAQEIVSCGTYLQLQAVKAEYGEDASRAAWKLISPADRLRLKGICQTGQQQPEEKQQPVTEEPAPYQVEPQQHKPRTLFSISNDLEKLNELLDEASDDAQQQQLINDWLEQLGEERDRKLDNYAALITEMQTRAEVRKSEAKRISELAASDENRAKLLKNRLQWFFETHNLKTVETARYRLQIQRNGGKAPLILDESVPVTQLPERFQRVSIDPNTTAIREALERGERLDFAQLGERGTSLRIK